MSFNEIKGCVRSQKGNWLYAIEPNTDQIVKINADTGSVEKRGPMILRFQLSLDESSIYAEEKKVQPYRGQPNPFIRIDPESLEIVVRGPHIYHRFTLAPDGSAIYTYTGKFVLLNPVTLEIEASSYTSGSPVLTPNGALYDEHNHRVARLNPKTLEIEAENISDYTFIGIQAFLSDGSAVYDLTERSLKIRRLHPQTLVEEAQGPHLPNHRLEIIVHPDNSALYAEVNEHMYTNYLARLDPQTLKITAHNDKIKLDSLKPIMFSVDGKSLCVTDWESKIVHCLDSKTLDFTTP